MITFTSRFVQVYVLLLILIAGVSADSNPELERRVLTEASRTLTRTAFRAARPMRAVARPMRMAVHPPPPPPPQAAKSGAGSTIAQSIFATKIASGILVAAGMHGATAADNKIAGEKRELLEDLLEKRTLTAAQQAARVATRSAFRAAARTAPRPQSFSRPLINAASHPPPPKPPSNFVNNAKKVGKFTAMGLTGGVGEYFGGRTMSNMLENMDKADGHRDKRSLADEDEELFMRTLPAGAGAVRTVARVGGAAMRTTARRTAAVRSTLPHSLPKQPPPPVPKKNYGNVKLFSAIFAGAAVENGLQTMTPEAAEKIKHDPKGSITKMFSGNVFGHSAGDKREFDEEGDLFTREAGMTGLDEELLERDDLDMILDDFE